MASRVLVAALAAPVLAGASFCDTSTDGSGWKMVWQDEFDQANLDNASWTIDLGAGDSRVRNSQGTADNVYLENGTLVLRTQREKSGSYNFTSGSVQTQDKKYWSGPTRVCVSAILPGGGGNGAGDGIWPAHWLMPNTKACWPTNGEIDIMEMVNGNGEQHGTYHWSPDGTCGKNSASSGSTKMPADWATAFHEYAVEYAPDHITFVVDGKAFHSVPSTSAKLFDVPWYVILNTAIEGPWPKPADAHTVLPTYHRIDYVRVAQQGKE